MLEVTLFTGKMLIYPKGVTGTKRTIKGKSLNFKISLVHILARLDVLNHAHCNIISHVNIFSHGISNKLARHLSHARCDE